MLFVDGDAMNLQLSINAAEDMLVIKDTTLVKRLGKSTLEIQESH